MPLPNTNAERAYTAIRAFRAAFLRDTTGFCIVAPNFPEVRACYSIVAEEWHLDQLQGTISELQNAPLSPSLVRREGEWLRAWLSLWMPEARRYGLTHVSDSSGQAADSPRSSAEFL